MRRALLSVLAGALVVTACGCREKSTSEKLKDAAESAQKDAAKAVEGAKKDAKKALDDLGK
jgi:hypothetical protein